MSLIRDGSMERSQCCSLPRAGDRSGLMFSGDQLNESFQLPPPAYGEASRNEASPSDPRASDNRSSLVKS